MFDVKCFKVVGTTNTFEVVVFGRVLVFDVKCF